MNLAERDPRRHVVCVIQQELTNYENFTDIIASQEELERSVVVKQIFYVPVVKHALKPELGAPLQSEIVESIDVVAVIRGIRTSVFRMEKGQQVTLWIQDRRDPLHHRFYQRLCQIVRDVPT